MITELQQQKCRVLDLMDNAKKRMNFHSHMALSYKHFSRRNDEHSIELAKEHEDMYYTWIARHHELYVQFNNLKKQ